MSALGGKPIVPAAVASLDLAQVVEALARHACNVTDAAADLAVPASDLRRLLWANSKLQDEAFEVVESRIDKAEKNIMEALGSEDSRRRDAASFFVVRNTARAKRRGWITSSVASVDVNIGADLAPRRIVVRWRNPGESDDDKPDEDVWRPPVYDTGRRDDGGGDDCLEGELAAPAVLLERQDEAPEFEVKSEPEAESESESVASEPEPAAVEPEPAAVRYERERIDAWIRNRLINWPLASCLRCRKPIVAGQDWQEASNGEARARFHRACHIEWRSERETAARQALGLEG
jgi:hypothetical protein